jgi:hypothetical protein
MSSEPTVQPPTTEPSAAKPRTVRKKRVFMLHDPKTMKGVGRFTSTTPRGAAEKAASRGFQDILLRETGTRIILRYTGAIVKLDPPKTVDRGTTTVTFTKKSVVKYTSKSAWDGSADVCDDSQPTVENPKAVA